MTKINWTEKAVKDLEKLDRAIAQRILKKISWFSKNLKIVTPEPLSGEFKETYKLRIGGWRVVYTLKEKSITIQFVGHRREVYK